MMPETGIPSGSSTAGSSRGLFVNGAVHRLLGCAAGRPQSGVHGCPVQSMHSLGGWSDLPSHQMSPSGRRATLVNRVSCEMIVIAFGLVVRFVPGTTPK